MPNFSDAFLGPKDRRNSSDERRSAGERRTADGRYENCAPQAAAEDESIVTFSPYALKELVSAQDAEQRMSEPQMIVQQHDYKIQLAHTKTRFENASMLVQRMYLRQGYDIPSMQKTPDHITLTVSQNGAVAGTITLGIDADNGLLADEHYRQEVDQLRAEGRHVCELTKFAVDQTLGSKPVLAALFNIAYIYGRVLQKQTDVIIEVTPKHAKFYQRMVGFKPMGPARLNSRVNTVGVLLRLEIDYMDRQIERWGGKADQAAGERSLYPYFFSREDEKGITQRLLRSE